MHQQLNHVETHALLMRAQQKQEEQKAKDAELQRRVDEFLNRPENVERAKEWAKTHPGERLPVYYFEEEDKILWLNRKQRARLAMWEKKQKKKAERALSALSKAAAAQTQGLHSAKSNSSASHPNQQPKHPKEGADEQRNNERQTPSESTDDGADCFATEGADSAVCESDLQRDGLTAGERFESAGGHGEQGF